MDPDPYPIQSNLNKIFLQNTVLQLSVQTIENYDTSDGAEKDNKTMISGTAVNGSHQNFDGVGSGSGSRFGSASK